ncbi:benzoyl-CoA-dihydrodiol lyase [Bradyrhizobium sp. GM2.4]
MAEEDRRLAGGATFIDFQTEPSRYRHWKLAVDGDVATLTMDVDENGGLFEGYLLKLNSYDLGVDIELADAVQRLRFEHPEVKVVVMRSAKNRVFCAGANIRMLAGSTHAHKVNFCKFTNETRNGMEDSSENSGQRFITVVNGSAAGGGYELALATDYIMLADDGASAVALPEVPLLAVLPGTGGLTRVVDKRKVRRDHADFFCTIEEGVKGKRAVQWRLVDEIAPNSKLEGKVAERAREFAQASKRKGSGKGIALTPLKRIIDETSIRYGFVTVDVDRAARIATISIKAPEAAPPADIDGMMAQGVAFWPLQVARELDDAILHLRINELEIAMLVFKSHGDRAHVLACDAFLEANKAHWLVNEIRHYWKRVLKRIDVTSRTLVTLVEPGSCFAGTLAELVFGRRPFLHADRHAPGRQPPAAVDRTVSDEFWPVSDEPWPDAASVALPGRSVRCGTRGSHDGHRAGRRAGRRARSRHLRTRRHRLGRRGPRVPGGARQLLARQPHRHGSQPALRRPRDDGIEDLLAPHRVAELDLPAPQRGRRGRRAAPLRQRPEAEIRYDASVEREWRVANSE